MKPSFGYFGVEKVYWQSSGGRLVFYRRRRPFAREWRFRVGRADMPLFRLPRRRDARLNRVNEEAAAGNALVARRIQEERRRRKGLKVVFFVIDSVSPVGGVGRRWSIQFDWLTRHDVLPVLVAQYNRNPALQRYPQLIWAPAAPNAEETLLGLVKACRPDVVEFNVIHPGALHSVDLDAFKRCARVGCMIHANVPLEAETLLRLDYRCATSVSYLGDLARHVTQIPNPVLFPAAPSEYSPVSDKALYVGRIDKEKLPTVLQFVRLCRERALAFDIAGPVTSDFPEALKPFCIGPVDTRRYLAEHGARYAFVGGVGQVALEAMAADLPAFLPTHDGAAARPGVFAQADCVAFLRRRNCVVTRILTELPDNIDVFFEARRLAASGDASALSAFRNRAVLAGVVDHEALMRCYESMLIGRDGPGDVVP